MQKRILRLRDVIQKTGLARSTIYSLISKDQFPKQVMLSPRCVGWSEDDVNDWVLSKLKGSR
jgi:prophage regulatory protein